MAQISEICKEIWVNEQKIFLSILSFLKVWRRKKGTSEIKANWFLRLQRINSKISTTVLHCLIVIPNELVVFYYCDHQNEFIITNFLN